MLDKDGDGYIEEKELAEILGFGGKQDQNDIFAMRSLIHDVDTNDDHRIDLEEFKRMLQGLGKAKAF